jgi:Prokaryotic E2 family A
MANDFLSPGGEPISPDALRIEKARNLAEFVRSGLHPWAQFLESRVLDEQEVVVLDLSIEVGQMPVHPILDTERVATIFDAADETYPEVLSLRPDFPRVLHLNARPTEFPRSLCLYEEPYDELKLRWTAPNFVERIRFWLRETARGELHQPDQPLEQILVGANVHLVLPSDLFETTLAGNAARLEVFRCAPGPRGEVLIAEHPHQRRQSQPGTKYVTTAFCCPPQVHSAVRFVPRTLTQLHGITLAAGLDLVSALRDRLDAWQRENAPLDCSVILVVFFPKTRTTGAEVESSDIWAFMSPNTVRDFGAALGLWQVQNGMVGRLLSTTPAPVRGDDILFDVVNPTLALSRDRAAFLNGVAPDSRRIVAIGLGALGSQIVTKLIRSGYGIWSFVDPDFLLPHIPRDEFVQPEVVNPARNRGGDAVEHQGLQPAPICRPVCQHKIAHLSVLFCFRKRPLLGHIGS